MQTASPRLVFPLYEQNSDGSTKLIGEFDFTGAAARRLSMAGGRHYKSPEGLTLVTLINDAMLPYNIGDLHYQGYVVAPDMKVKLDEFYAQVLKDVPEKGTVYWAWENIIQAEKNRLRVRRDLETASRDLEKVQKADVVPLPAHDMVYSSFEPNSYVPVDRFLDIHGDWLYAAYTRIDPAPDPFDAPEEHR